MTIKTPMKLRTLFALAAAAIAATLSACGDREHIPTAPAAGPVVLSVAGNGPTWIGLTWDAPAEIDASGGTRVFRDGVLVGMSTEDAWTDRQLTPGTQYGYRVTTIDAEGHESGLSNNVTASTPRPTAITLAVSPSAASIEVGDQLRLTATVRDSATGQLATGHAVTWTSGNTALATAGTDGTITAVAIGTVTITAASEGITATATVTVRPRSAVSVVVTPGQSSMQTTKTAVLTATARDAGGAVLTGKTFIWASSDPSVATVSPAGVVTAIAAGAVTIAATTDGVTGTAAVTVVAGGGNTDPDVASLTVNPGSVSLAPGATGQIVATTRDGGGSVITNKPITWSTSNNAVATVSQTGMVTAVTDGSTTITAASGGLTASATITVLTSGGGPIPVATVSVTPSTSTIATGATVQLSATTRDANGNTLVGRSIVWSSTNTSVATVSAAGLVTAVSAGAAIINAVSEGVTGSATVTVNAPPPIPVASIMITPPSVSIAIGATSQLSATTKDALGATLTGRVVTWSSSDNTVATVSATGLVTGVAVGAAVITATSEGVNASITATITPKPVISVTITGSGPVCVGASLQLTAIPRDIDGNPLTGRVVVWTTSTGLLASVSPTGLVLGVALGSVTITATVEGVSTSVTLGICAPIVATVSVSSPSTLLGLLGGLLHQMTAQAKDANGNVILGRPVTWSVTPPAKALISLNGLLTPLGLGPITVTATIDGVSGSVAVSIVP